MSLQQQTSDRAQAAASLDDDDDWLAAPAASVQAATQAFGNMRILQPMPTLTQDGGVYDRVLADAQPVSAATASAASAAHASDGARGPLDPVLVACLDNARERLTLLKFEDAIVRFLRNGRERQLVLPPLSSYHRLIVHRLADRCGLEHQTAEYNPYAAAAAGPSGAYDGNSVRAVTLFKTAVSDVPSVLLIDLSADRQQQNAAPASVPKIMVRKRSGPRPGTSASRGAGDAKNAQRTMQDRERAYAEARARIFGDDSAAAAAAEPTTATASSVPAPATGSSGSAAPSSKLNANSQQAAGPDGSRGFGNRRGRGGSGNGGGRGSTPAAAVERSPHQHQQTQSAPAALSSSSEFHRSDSGPSTSDQRPAAVRAQSTHNWKESKVLWRNREQELNDPDFARHRPVRTTSGGGGRNAHSMGGRYSSGGPAPIEFYDNAALPPRQPPFPQQFGYAQPPQPPFPGRRPSPGEFSRVDRPPPPPPDHFRNGGRYPLAAATNNNPPMPPPPMPMGMGPPRANSYSHYSPQHARHYAGSPSPMRNGNGDGSSGSGGYNDADFPPLGK